MITETTNPNDVQPTPSTTEPTTDFDAFAATMPETAQGFLDAALPPSASVGDEPGDGFLDAPPLSEPAEPGRKRVNITKKMRKAMNRFKTKIADIPIMWFHTQAKANPEWELDDDEKALITDAIETVFDVLDIEVEIEPLSWTLTSVWWVISYPVLAFVFLFLTKKSLIMEHDQHETV